MATHSGILAWKIPWTEEPGGPQIGFTRTGHDIVAKQQQLYCDIGFGGDPAPNLQYLLKGVPILCKLQSVPKLVPDPTGCTIRPQS